MSKEESSQQQMQAEQPQEEPRLTTPTHPHRGYRPRVGSGGDADLGYLTEDGDPKFLRPRREIAQL